MTDEKVSGGPEAVLNHYATKINLHRFDELAPLLSNEAVFWFSDGSHRGLDEIRAAFERTWQVIQNETYWLDGHHWIAASDGAACCTYRFHWAGMVNNAASAGQGRGTTVLRKEGGGWKIVHEHLSGLPR